MADSRIPPGQYLANGWPVLHYGPVPRFSPQRWDFRVWGATSTPLRLGWEDWQRLPRCRRTADFHCVTKFSVLGNEWEGVAARTLLELAPPLPECSHVMVWAEYGYGANVRLGDLTADATLFAMHRNGEPLTPEHGFPVRLVVPHLYAWKGAKWVRGMEYLTEDRRGFWEERGYHNEADPWQEQRYSYQEDDAGD